MKDPGWGWFKYHNVESEERKHWVGNSPVLRLLITAIVIICGLLAYLSYKTGLPLFKFFCMRSQITASPIFQFERLKHSF